MPELFNCFISGMFIFVGFQIDKFVNLYAKDRIESITDDDLLINPRLSRQVRIDSEKAENIMK